MIFALASTTFYGLLNSYVFNKGSIEWNQRCVSILNAILGVLGCAMFSNYLLASIMTGHVLWDLYYIIKNKGDISIIIHHAVYGAGTLYTLYSNKFMYVVPYVVIGELSTIFLELRWFLSNMKMKNSSVYKVTNSLFVVSFTTTRIVLYPFGLRKVISDPGPWTFGMSSCLFALIAMYGLNLFWFSIILTKIRKMLLNDAARG